MPTVKKHKVEFTPLIIKNGFADGGKVKITAKKKKNTISSKLAVKLCDHDFKYSHIEHPPFGTYGTYIPPDKEVVVCRKCGQIIKNFVI